MPVIRRPIDRFREKVERTQISNMNKNTPLSKSSVSRTGMGLSQSLKNRDRDGNRFFRANVSEADGPDVVG